MRILRATRQTRLSEPMLIMSAKHQKADIRTRAGNVAEVPEADSSIVVPQSSEAVSLRQAGFAHAFDHPVSRGHVAIRQGFEPEMGICCQKKFGLFTRFV